MNDHSLVTVYMTADDYEDLLDFLRCCAVESAKCSELVDLAADLRFYCDLLESNRR